MIKFPHLRYLRSLFGSMLLFLSQFTFSVFVPYDQTILPKLQKFDDFTFEKFQPLTKIVITMVIPKCNPTQELSFITFFSRAMVFYTHIADFGYFKEEEGQMLVNSVHMEPPFLAFFYNGRLASFSEMPMSEEGLAFKLASWLDPDHKVISTMDELHSSLGELPFTILTRAEDTTQAAYASAKVFNVLGSSNVLKLSNEMMEKVGLKDSMFGLFRDFDNAIVPCTNSSESFVYASKPFVQEITDELLERRNMDFAVYINESFDETKASIMEPLGEEFLKIVTGVVTNNTIRFVQHVMNSTKTPSFLVMNYYAGYYYPMTLENIDINDPTFLTKAKELIQKIQDGKVEKKYYSEPIPRHQTPPVTKIVGLTYKDFVEDPLNDVVILFYDSSQPEIKYFDEFKAACYAAKVNVENIKFGYIDIRYNASPLQFPIIVNLPHVEFFPKNNKTNPQPMIAQPSEEAYLRFFKEEKTVPGKINVPEMSNETATIESFVLTMNMNNFPERYRPKAIEYLKKLENITGIPVFKQPGEKSENEQIDFEDL